MTRACPQCGERITNPIDGPKVHQNTGRIGCAETTLPPMALDKDTLDGLKQAGRKVHEWTIERDSRIRQAVRDGGSLREVGAAVGLTHTAVGFIANGRRRR